MSRVWPFVGRQEELALITQAMGDPAVGGLVLAGPAGVGKTRLALEALSHADPDRYVSRRVAATQATQPIPFGALATLLPARLPAASDQINLLRLAAEALVAIAGERRLALGVDDAQLLDDLSAGLLHQIVRTGAAFVVIVVRSDQPAPDAVTALWRNRVVERIDLERLLRPDVEQVMVQHLGGPVDGSTVERLWQASAGNPLMVRELVAAGGQAGALHRVEGVWTWQGPWVFAPRLVEVIEQRLGQLDSDERDVLELLAFADPIGPDLLCRLVTPAAIEAIEAKGLCWAEQQGRRLHMHLGHPLYGEVLRARIPVLRARRRQRQLADVVEQTGARRADDWLQVASWRLASGATVSAQGLLAAAARALAVLDLALTERLARAALREGAALEASKILWQALILQGRIDEALHGLAGLDDAADTDHERAQLAIARANLYWGHDPGDIHLRVIDEALAKIVDPLARAELEGLKAAIYVHASQFEPAARLADDLLRRRGLPGKILAFAHFARAMTLLFQGKAGQAATTFASAVAANEEQAESPWVAPIVVLWRCQAQLLDGDLTNATTTAEASYRRTLASGSDMIVGLACLQRGQVCRARGQLQDSLRWLREGLAAMRNNRTFVSQLRGELAHTAALLGDHATAEAALAEADATHRHNFVIYQVWLDLARPWVTAARGDRTAAVHQALGNAVAFQQISAPVYEAEALHDVCRLGAAGKAADRLHALARSTGGNVLINVYAAHARALAGHDGRALERVSADLTATGALLLAAECAAEAAAAHRRAGRADSARRMATKAARLAAQCEGAATPALQGLRAPDLTPRQWEIVKLAAAELTNEEIADRLVVSVRTVHNHLHQAYAKLGVHSRAELASVLGEHPQGPWAPEHRRTHQA